MTSQNTNVIRQIASSYEQNILEQVTCLGTPGVGNTGTPVMNYPRQGISICKSIS